MSVELEIKENASAIVTLYNKCLRCHRKIKAPQEYGRVCAKKIKDGAVALADTGKGKQDVLPSCGVPARRLAPDSRSSLF